MFAGGCRIDAAQAVCDAFGDLGLDTLEGIVATATNGRTMPLCKFPEEASYLGGNVNLASSWTCNASDTRMLAVGTTGATAGAGAATAHQYLIDPIPIGLNDQ